MRRSAVASGRLATVETFHIGLFVAPELENHRVL
jgi:hypothetical protein